MRKFIRTPIALFAVFFFEAFVVPKNFLAEQKTYQRVRTAFDEKGKFIAAKLTENNIDINELNMLIIVFKAEKQLELYAKNKAESAYKKISTYSICSSSGQLGPKKRQGDNQVPEGYYTIDRFNPASNFYLSLRISYPNKSDKITGDIKNPGGDIFIHGSCVTIGCIPMTDDKIKEIYLYAIQARQNEQMNIPVYIFPFKMTDKNFNSYKSEYKNNTELTGFWANLKTGFDQFEKDKKPLNYVVDENGKYIY